MDIMYWAQQNSEKIAFVAVFIALFNQFVRTAIDKFFKFVFGFVFSHKVISDDETLNVILNYLKKHGKSYGFSTEDTIGFKKTFVPADAPSFKRFIFAVQLRFSYRLFFLGKVPLFLTPTVLTNDDSKQYSTFIFFRWSLNWRKFLTDVATFNDGREEDTAETRFKVTLHSGEGKTYEKSESPKSYSNDDQMIIINDIDIVLATPSKSDRLNKISLTDGMKKLIADLNFWFKGEQWYRERGIPWKYGCILYGEPGTGKSSIIRALAEHHDIPVHIFNLGSMKDDDLQQAWTQAAADGKRFCVFEDIDGVYHGRERVEEGKGPDFDSLLNIIDGISKEEGLAVFFTTNKFEHIDAALAREGRAGKHFEISGLTFEGRVQMAKRILKDDLMAQKLAIANEKVNGADFQDLCMQEAVKMYWGQK